MKVRTKILSLFLCLILGLNVMATQDDARSKLFILKSIDDNINALTFDKIGEKYDPEFNNFDKFSVIMDHTAQLEKVATTFASELNEKEKNELPIKGEDLAIMRALMRSMILIMEKTSIFTNIYKKAKTRQIKMSSEELDAQKEIASLLAKLNYLKAYKAAYHAFYKSSRTKRMAKEVARVIENDKDKEILKQFTKIARHDDFQESLQREAKQFLEFRNYYLQLLKPMVTTGVVQVEKFDLRKNVIDKEIPKIKVSGIGDWFVEIFSKTTNFISGLFGNLVGKLRFRHGYMKDHEGALKYLYGTLKPLDIIAEKTPFAATDFFIPGHFGHIAVYIGTQAQLEEAGLWNHPSIKKIKKDIQAGKTILESIRPGSRMVSLEEFLEIDEITIIRETNILDNKWQKEQVLATAIEQLNKDYDFNFDVSTLKKVVCSEVPYHAFGHKRWTTSYIFGRNTISPDEIIENAYTRGSGIEFIASIQATKDGKLKGIDKEKMAKNLSFDFDKKKNLFTKETKECRLVRVVQHRNKNDHYIGKKYRYYKKCKKVDTPLIYSAL